MFVDRGVGVPALRHEDLARQPMNGGQIEEILSFDDDEPFDFGYSPDGRYVAVTRGEWQQHIVLISDLTPR